MKTRSSVDFSKGYIKAIVSKEKRGYIKKTTFYGCIFSDDPVETVKFVPKELLTDGTLGECIKEYDKLEKEGKQNIKVFCCSNLKPEPEPELITIDEVSEATAPNEHHESIAEDTVCGPRDERQLDLEVVEVIDVVEVEEEVKDVKETQQKVCDLYKINEVNLANERHELVKEMFNDDGTPLNPYRIVFDHTVDMGGGRFLGIDHILELENKLYSGEIEPNESLICMVGRSYGFNNSRQLVHKFYIQVGYGKLIAVTKDQVSKEVFNMLFYEFTKKFPFAHTDPDTDQFFEC
uniref:DUF4806 domain-containing protein n=1 Tax=Parastrongyloides trichosuri TaxID=131310 RepID=A0A0N4ZGM4_PARTI